MLDTSFFLDFGYHGFKWSLIILLDWNTGIAFETNSLSIFSISYLDDVFFVT